MGYGIYTGSLKSRLRLLFLIGMFGFSGMLWATIISPTSIVSNTLGEFSATGAFAEERIIDGSGLPEDFNESSLHAASGDFAWSSPSGVTTGTIRFDLGALFSLDSFVLWNNTGSSGGDQEGVREFRLSFFNESENLLGTTAVLSATDVLSLPQLFSFSVVPNVRLVDFEILSNHGHSSFTGVQEVAFVATPAVPEPGACLLFLFSCFFLLKWRL